MKKLPENLPELTSSRGIAAFSVVMFHIFFEEGGQKGFVESIISDGHLGVDFFFILSGFILTHVYSNSLENKSFNYYDFLSRRVARIYPLHIFMIVAFILLYQVARILGFATAAEGQNWSDLPYHILLLHAWGFTDSHSWNFPSWSVSAEAFAYITFPLILWAALRLKSSVRLVVSLLIFLSFSILSLAIIGQEITKLMYNFGIIRIGCEFFMGVCLYLTIRNLTFSSNLVQICLAGSIALIIFLAAIQASELLIVILMAVTIGCLAELSRKENARILRSKFAVYIGEISYSTYMVHILVIMCVRSLAPKFGFSPNGWHSVLLMLFLIYLSSVILYHLLERPARRYVQRFLL